jgi:FAD/FMN-containing dehydrogenase
MRITCPSCGETYPIDAGFADDDGKRLAALFADMEPALGRAAISYLRLFKPPKTALRAVRAAKLIEDLLALVRTGTVCRDERAGLRRPATPALWAAGIEQMLAAPGKLALPLSNHYYLRAIVYGLADQADAANERQREENLRAGRRADPSDAARPESRLRNELAYLRQQLNLGILMHDEYERRAAEARERLGGGDGKSDP